jgi:cytochrome c oxidase subunit I
MTGNSTSHRMPSYLEYQGKYTGIRAWILSTDHKRIALLYLYWQLFFFLAGLVMG